MILWLPVVVTLVESNRLDELGVTSVTVRLLAGAATAKVPERATAAELS